MENAQIIFANIRANEHANLDSFPLRYGFYFQKDTVLKLFNCRNLKWQIGGIKFEVDANFIKPDGSVAIGHFILMKTDDTLLKVVTVWRNDQEDEFYISKLLTSLRKSGKITTSDLLEIYPLYENGKANSFEDLASIVSFRQIRPKMRAETDSLVKIAKSEARAEYQKLVSKLRDAEKHSKEQITILLSQLKQKESVLDSLKAQNIEMAKKLGIIEAEVTAYKTEFEKVKNNKPSLRLNLDNIGVLENVKERVLYKGSFCTLLVLSDGRTKAMKTSTFDKDFQITRKARGLVGKKIKTTSWDPVLEPGKWSRQGYFMNLYEA